MDNLTVHEMLLYTAEMKLEMAVSMAEKREKVEELLKQLALDVCRNVRIGSDMQRGISGMFCRPFSVPQKPQSHSYNTRPERCSSPAPAIEHWARWVEMQTCSCTCMFGLTEQHILAQVGRQSAAT